MNSFWKEPLPSKQSFSPVLKEKAIYSFAHILKFIYPYIHFFHKHLRSVSVLGPALTPGTPGEYEEVLPALTQLTGQEEC